MNEDQKPLTEDEMVEILTYIARNGNNAERISAIRQLRLLGKGESAEEDPFEGLYGK